MTSTMKAGRKGLMAGLLLLSALAIAGTVIVNGRSFRCQNTCVVGTTSNGGWYVYDSLGGSIVETTRTQLQ